MRTSKAKLNGIFPLHALWTHWPNKNVFSDCLKRLYMTSPVVWRQLADTQFRGWINSCLNCACLPVKCVDIRKRRRRPIGGVQQLRTKAISTNLNETLSGEQKMVDGVDLQTTATISVPTVSSRVAMAPDCSNCNSNNNNNNNSIDRWAVRPQRTWLLAHSAAASKCVGKYSDVIGPFDWHHTNEQWQATIDLSREGKGNPNPVYTIWHDLGYVAHSPTSLRAVVGIGFKALDPSHSHGKKCGNPKRILIPIPMVIHWKFPSHAVESVNWQCQPSVAEHFRLPLRSGTHTAQPDNVVSASSVDSFQHQRKTFLGSNDHTVVSTLVKWSRLYSCTIQRQRLIDWLM